MKKLLLSFSMIALFLGTAFAQDLEVIEVSEAASDGKLMTKRGAPILPEAGDWGIGIDATPFLEYVGNSFNGNTNNQAPFWNFSAQYPMHIYGRYMVDENTAYRALVRIGFNSLTQEDDAGNKRASSQFTIGLGAGIEKNKSMSNRIRGYYGAMAGIFYLGDSTVTTTPATGNEVKRSGGNTFAIGLRGFVGAEYFFAPKMSLGGEFGWGLVFASTNARIEDDGAGNEIELAPKSTAIRLDTDNGAIPLAGFSGQLLFTIYF